MTVSMADYKSNDPIAWCPGCGDFGILMAVKQALVALELRPRDICMVSGIGQAAKLPHYLLGNVFNGLHGRALPVATGVKLANPQLTVLAIGGDGDGYAEGGNHFIHALRRNPGITYIVHDNRVFALTKGQASPLSVPGFVTSTTPWGQIASPFEPLATAIVHDASFVARGYSGDPDHLASLIQEGVRCGGFALINVLQVCVTYNKINTMAWYKERVYKMEEYSHDRRDAETALRKAAEWGKRIPIGVFYRGSRPAYETQVPALKNGIVPARAPLERHDVNSVLNEFY